jgi:hypothetical protein
MSRNSQGDAVTRTVWLAPLSALGLVVLYVVVYVWQPGGRHLLSILSDTLWGSLTVLAAVFAFRASRMFEPRVPQRRAWLLFAIGIAMGALAEFLWAYQQVFLSEVAPYPSPADALWVIGYIPLVASMAIQYRALGVAPSLRLRLIALPIYLLLLVATFVIVLQPVLSNPGSASGLQRFLNLFYPIADLGLAFIATLSLLVFWGGLAGRPWLFIVISMLLFAVADLAFSYGVSNGTYLVGGNLLSGVADVAYLAAYAAAAVGAHRQATLSLPPVDDDQGA